MYEQEKTWQFVFQVIFDVLMARTFLEGEGGNLLTFCFAQDVIIIETDNILTDMEIYFVLVRHFYMNWLEK